MKINYNIYFSSVIVIILTVSFLYSALELFELSMHVTRNSITLTDSSEIKRV